MCMIVQFTAILFACQGYLFAFPMSSRVKNSLALAVCVMSCVVDKVNFYAVSFTSDVHWVLDKVLSRHLLPHSMLSRTKCVVSAVA